MVEIEIRTGDPRASVRSIVAVLTELQAIKGEGGQGHAGSVDAVWRSWTLDTGDRIEIWSDNWTPLSLRGEIEVLDRIISLCGLERVNG
ncbi:hypothetical protein [Qipengyuania sphaerica]|uniref:hypothetical protein n=1 Tax=Qipengyuania sphaerica TaxID=2867243 RepID=UPI001C87ED44|nr:hypothetical protein [Qipengyuania sphaerica]MBX7539615.1 hypothetical protein [Qipengyuania sphaerica]